MLIQRCEEKSAPSCGGERERENARIRMVGRGVERERALWLPFLYVFIFPLGLPYANWA